MPFSVQRFGYAALFAAIVSQPSRAQRSVRRGDHDSITVTTVTFPGVTDVPVADIKRLIFTRASTCRLPFLIPVCARTLNQVSSDRRRTTSAALGDDITAIRVYLWRRGFREAQVDTVLTPGKLGTSVAFVVSEGPATRIGNVSITQRSPVLSDKEIADVVEIHAGEPLNFFALDSTLAHLKSAVWNKGYGDVKIDTSVPRPDATHMVPVRIDIDPRWITRIGRVDFDGNHYLDAATLRRGVVLQPGSLYTRDAVLESQKRLFVSPAIARALVVTPTGGDSVKTVLVDVAEMPRQHVELSVGFNTIDFGMASVVAQRNSLGAGRWASLRASVGNLLGGQLDGRFPFHDYPDDGAGDAAGFLKPTYQGTLTLTQPWLHDARTSASVSAFASRRSVPSVVIDEDMGVTAGVVHDLSVQAPLGLNYRLETTRVQGSAIYYCAGYGICDTPTRTALSRAHRLAPLAVSAWIDRSDDLEVPTRGYTGVIDAEHASSLTGSTFAHNRISGDGSLYHSFGARKVVLGEDQLPTVFAFHVRGGFVRPLSSDRAALGVAGPGEGILHPRARFYAGGMQSVRGFAENELGPTVLQVRRESLLGRGCTNATIDGGTCDPSAVPSSEFFARPVGGSTLAEGSVEIRKPLGQTLIGVVFVDGGYVGVNGLSSIAHGKGAVTPGAGLRVRSPLGVVRFDIGLRPVGTEALPVVVSSTDAAGNGQITQLSRMKEFSPLDPSGGRLSAIGRQLVVHFAMGQAW